MNTLTRFMLTVATITLSGCAMTVDKARLDQIETTATVGFTAYVANGRPMYAIPETSELNLLRDKVSNDLYESFASSYAKKLNVKVLMPSEMLSTLYYQQMMKKYGMVEDKSNYMPPNFRNSRMLSAEAVFRMTPQERFELAKALKVDAIVGVESYFNGSEHNGQKGSYYFQPQLIELGLYDQLSAEPVAVVKNMMVQRSQAEKEETQAVISAMETMVDKLSDGLLYGDSY